MTPSGPSIVVISDDLTGAVAAAGEAARAGAATSVVGWDAPVYGEHGVDVIVIDTNSRLLTADHAAERVRTVTRRALAELPDAIPYKRVDSQLRGNTAREVRVWSEAIARPVLVVPAAPVYGITTLDGVQRWRDEPLRAEGERTQAMTPIEMLAGRHLDLAVIRGGALAPDLAGMLARAQHVIVDAARLDDISRIVQAASGVTTPFGLLGSYGLLGAWVALSRPRPRPETGVLVLATSYQDRTRAQIDNLRESPGIRMIAPGLPEERLAVEIAAGLDDGHDVVVATADAAAAVPDPGVAARAARAVVAAIASALPAGLVLSGGEGASAVIRLLAPERLDVVAEPWPATPVTRLVGGRHHGLLAVIQSGSQGDPSRALHTIDTIRGIARHQADTALTTPGGSP